MTKAGRTLRGHEEQREARVMFVDHVYQLPRTAMTAAGFLSGSRLEIVSVEIFLGKRPPELRTQWVERRGVHQRVL